MHMDFIVELYYTRDTQTTNPFNSLLVLIQLLADNGPSIWNLELVIWASSTCGVAYNNYLKSRISNYPARIPPAVDI